jgi:hypothetical protein
VKFLSEKITDVKTKMEVTIREQKDRINDLELQVALKNDEINKMRGDLEKSNKTARSAQQESLKLK